MTENKKTTNRLDTRAKYEAPQVWCFPVETEAIMAGSPTQPMSFDNANGGTIEDTEKEGFFGQ